jgi:two-component system, cell cycle sensor histidine kinase and response regulator CckA
VFGKDITERKQAEEALRESESRFRAFVEQSPVAIGVFSLEGIGLYANRKYIETLGMHSIEEMVGRPAFELFAPQFREESKERTRRRLQGLPVPDEYETVAARADGSQFPAHLAIASIQLPGGAASIAFLTDITERKRVEDALRVGEERYQNLFDQAIVVISDKDGKWLKISPLFSELIGYGMQELVGMNYTQITHPDDLAINLEQNKRMAEGQIDNFILEKRYLHKSGSVVWVNISVTSIRDTSGALVQTISVIQDITERKQAEEKIRQSEKKYHELFRVNKDGIAIFLLNPYGPPTAFVEVNEAAHQMLGYTREEMLKLTPVMLESNIPQEQMRSRQAELKSNGILHFETILRHKNGHPVFTEFTAQVIEYEGKPAVMNIVRDVSERKQVEEEKLSLQEQLLQAQKMESVGRLAGGVAHDFNNLLGVIIGRAEIALAKVAPHQPVYQDLYEILNAGERSADLTRQLLAFARKQPMSPVVLDLNKAVSNIFEMLHRLIGEDINLVWTPSPDLWHVRMDSSQVDQMLTNLVVNARDAISEIGEVAIKTCNIVCDEGYAAKYPGLEPGEYVLLTVSDNGGGMDEETCAQIFEPFFTTKELGKGTGLGLSTVFGIVKQNSGVIKVNSEPGQGTTFSIYLPRIQSEITAPITINEVARAPQRASETILMVDDEEALLEMGKEALEEIGYTVLAASTPTEAQRLVDMYTGEIHLLISDVVMPGMNGKVLIERLRSRLPGLKCLFMSGYTADIITDRGVLPEGISFIQKPFPLENLARKVREVLEGK